MPADLGIPPTYREIAAEIAAAINAGQYERGSLLPGARELARKYGVAMSTIHRAMALLQEQGLVVGRQGRGQYVTGGPDPDA